MSDTSIPQDEHVEGLIRASQQGQKSEKESASQKLIALASTVYDFFVDSKGKPYGVRKGGHVAIPLTNSRRSVRKELGGLYCRYSGKPASQTALTEAMAVLEYEAEEGGVCELHLRSARTLDDEVYVDMGDTEERVIRITSEGWDILDRDAEIPVMFRRTTLTQPLPTPEKCGDFSQLWDFVNVKGEADRQLITGWVLGSYVLIGMPCPALVFLGEQGTAKTSSARTVFAVFDPTAAAVRRPPKDIDRLLHAGAHSRGVVFDNLSHIPSWLSDGFCRYVTGESDVDRALFTDDDARIIDVQGVLAFTTIDVGALNSDLAERAVWANLKIIPASERESERTLKARWMKAYSSIVGGALDLVVQVLQKLPEVHLSEKPRMADFAEVLAAMDLATGTQSLTHYVISQGDVASEIVGTDTFLRTLTSTIEGRWEGTGKDLHDMLERPENDKYWPEVRGMSGKLKRVAPDLRKAGWQVDEIVPDAGSKRPKTWVLVSPGVTVSDDDVVELQIALDEMNRDVAEWKQRVLDAGATADCVDDHVGSFRASYGLSHIKLVNGEHVSYDGCGRSGCRIDQTNVSRTWAFPAKRSKVIDQRFVSARRRVGLSQDEIAARMANFAGAVSAEVTSA